LTYSRKPAGRFWHAIPALDALAVIAEVGCVLLTVNLQAPGFSLFRPISSLLVDFSSLFIEF
jgi:hypothetical protein